MYMLFAGHDYYPSGGWDDFQYFITSDSLSDADREKLKGYDWYQIASTQGIVSQGDLY